MKKHKQNKIVMRHESLLLHGVGFVTGDPTIKLSYPFVFHPGLRVSVTEPGDNKWLYMMIPLSKGSLIKGVNVACHSTGIDSYINHIRLVEQREPIAATVVFDEILEREISLNSSFIKAECNVIVNRSILLKLCLDFSDTTDIIEIGSVEVKYIPDFEQSREFEKMEKKMYHEKQQKMLEYNETMQLDNTVKQNISFVDMLFSRKKRKKQYL